MAHTFRIREEEAEMLKEATMRIIIEKKVRIRESDILHTLIRNYVENLKSNDVLKYREEFLDKDD